MLKIEKLIMFEEHNLPVLRGPSAIMMLESHKANSVAIWRW